MDAKADKTDNAANAAKAAAVIKADTKGGLRYQCCSDCAAAQSLSRFACHRCGSEHLAWRDAAGSGTVYAVTVVTRAPSEAFRALVPYTLVLVDLDEGARVMAHGAPGLAIGGRVRARLLPFGDSCLNYFDSGAADSSCSINSASKPPG
jgi:uncharacterized protein